MICSSKFVSGDIAIAKKLIKFVDGTYHTQGQRIRVTDKTENYYNFYHDYYDKELVVDMLD